MAIKERDSVTAKVIDCDLGECSVEQATCDMKITVSQSTHLFVIYVADHDLFEAHKIAIALNKTVDNVLFRAEAHPKAGGAEWLLKHIETGKTFYSPGA